MVVVPALYVCWFCVDVAVPVVVVQVLDDDVGRHVRSEGFRMGAFTGWLVDFFNGCGTR